jgi:hypothetical protein
MDALKLIALDEQDLRIVSAHVQDAVMKVEELDFAARDKKFIVTMNRFAWEESGGFFRRRDQRRKCVLTFDRVVGVKTSKIEMRNPDEVLSLLAMRFEETEAPAGTIELIFSGDAGVRLEVECIEARLSDVGAAWEASSRPVHKS